MMSDASSHVGQAHPVTGGNSGPTDYLPSLNGFRAVSILMVLGAHAVPTTGWPSLVFDGTLGVRCFFVISGFLITYLLLQERKSSGQASLPMFYARRCLRILPAYLCFLIVLAVLTWITPLSITRCQWITSITYTKDFGCRTWIDGHLWSLSVEEQFYLLWPWLVAKSPARTQLAVALVLIAACPLVRVAFYILEVDRYYSPFTNADVLMFGCASALITHQYRKTIDTLLQWNTTRIRGLAITVLFVPPILESHFLLGKLTVPFATSVEAACMAYLICSYVFVPIGKIYRILNSRVMTYVGLISYSLYIWQQPFFSPPIIFGLDSLPVLKLPINIVAAFVMAVLSYHMLERPFLRLRSRFRGSDVQVSEANVSLPNLGSDILERARDTQAVI
jgi:peptidoglycan/LPS O-acetylase OafA/YrhL